MHIFSSLTGKSDSSLEVQGFGRKFIGVKAGGMLEFHGEDKLSWTKLAHTIPAAKQTCGSVYDHKVSPSPPPPHHINCESYILYCNIILTVFLLNKILI